MASVTYISLLRGINVSGQKIIKMADLKLVYESLKFTNVTTYVQSGNVVFQTATSPSKIASSIEEAIEARFSFEVPVLVRTSTELARVLGKNPLADADPSKLYVTFLSRPAVMPADEFEKLKQPGDRMAFVGKEVYFSCPGGYGRTKLNNNLLERKLKARATTRNWNTVTKLHELAQAIRAIP